MRSPKLAMEAYVLKYVLIVNLWGKEVVEMMHGGK
jgi:hypothetical protein